MSEKEEPKKKESVLGLLTPGFASAKKGIKATFQMDANFIASMNDMQTKLLEKEPESIIKSKSNDPSQRFKDGMKQFKITDQDIQKKAEQSTLMFNIMVIILAVILGIILVQFPTQNGFFSSLLFLMPSLSLISLLLSVIAKWGFYNYCIRNKIMGNFKEWITNPKEWLPSSTVNGIKILSLLVVLLSPMIHKTAYADSSSCNTSGSSSVLQTFSMPCNQDIYKNLLENIFPGVTPLSDPTIVPEENKITSGSNGSTALASAFQAFLSVLMSIAMAGLSYHIISTLVSVAHEGSVISQRWSVVWAPLRLFLGAGALTPFIKGYCIAQILVLYVAMWGGSLTNVMWSGYVTGLTSPSISASSVPNLMPTLQAIAQRRACWAVLNQVNSNPISSGKYSNDELPSSLDTSGVKALSGMSSDIEQPSVFLNKALGLGGLSSASTAADTNITTDRYVWDFGTKCGGVSVDVPNGGAYTAYGEAEVKAISDFIKSIGTPMDNIAKKTIAPDSTSIPDTDALTSNIQSAVNTSLTDWGDGVKNLANSLNSDAKGGSYIETFKQQATTYGWATAGTYYMTIARMQGMANELFQSAPITVHDGNDNGNNNNSQNEDLTEGASGLTYNLLLSNINQTLQGGTVQTTDTVVKNLSSAAKGGKIDGITVNNNTIFTTDDDSWINKIESWIGNLLGSAVNGFFNWTGSGATATGHDVSGSEMQNMTEFGQNMINIAETVLITVLGIKAAGTVGIIWHSIKAAGATATGNPVAGASAATQAALGVAMKAIGGLFAMIMALLSIFFTVGVVHAYILPMMPYIHFALFVMSMLIFVVEAMIAAPLWAFIHIKLNGQELIDHEQKTGYMLVFNLFLRAPLGMLGFFLSFAIFNAMIFFLKLTFYPAVQAGVSTSSDTFSVMGNNTGLVGTIIMIAMMTYLHFVIAMRSFSLISEVPNRVAKWFGAQGTESEQGLGEGIKNFAMGSLARGMTQNMMSMMGNGGRGGNPNGGGGGKANVPPAPGTPGSGSNTPTDPTSAGVTTAPVQDAIMDTGGSGDSSSGSSNSGGSDSPLGGITSTGDRTPSDPGNPQHHDAQGTQGDASTSAMTPKDKASNSVKNSVNRMARDNPDYQISNPDSVADGAKAITDSLADKLTSSDAMNIDSEDFEAELDELLTNSPAIPSPIREDVKEVIKKSLKENLG